MNEQKIYDMIGVGIGPFNLSIPAILSKVELTFSYLFSHNARICLKKRQKGIAFISNPDSKSLEGGI
ncbi:hypothetical protein AJ85_21325 [Alkalihalobacillus alcalophilus ATCC 27647 = CGMCC 1.3604]|uniref:Uncharacterized protein n=1 Tax=Alkalihalobacillus alcalophilus ATCC 27647 = CGMCC 1.3604 TaxID=1218173 RepID=A0A094XDR8_ALKAL|nr:SidA/IucD/PvdA family monooxygenase [Alkalihalobacillus alcalophilus]KGA96925.1 hypothetical protein BALCAV_0213295 [Alkalihalobacillus alcalophilus ATCC 27647 = CGMCC 1.3604]MED1562278.1 SidA/IucD/PvdA family monooxygenase [Alkalihalobacillus alcalophilus]THG88823.1 hypothetical protein AJ85_21325 [Alkalihalobacillus alcalophilus ATCC 27647 = CGMCC 1.3604]